MFRSLSVLLLIPSLAYGGDETPVPLATDMQTHWTFATNARDGVIHTDLATARLWGRGLAEAPQPESLPTKWRPMYAEMQAAATKVAQAPDLASAAAAVGKLGLTCAECHDFTGGGPGHLVLPMPEPKFDASKGDMPLHKWATEWLWVGLVSSDQASWDRGAKALLESPFEPHQGVTPEDEQMEHVTHIVASLAEKSDRASQSQRFGEVITACAVCHTDAQKTGLKAPPK